MEWFNDRWQRRREEMGMSPAAPPAPAMATVTVSEQITITADPGKVWQLVWNPATTPLVSDDVVSAFTLPGTPAGQVGEMQVSIVACKNGTLVGTVLEVVELGPGYRAVTRDRTFAHSGTVTTLVLPLDHGGCVLRLRDEQLVPTETASAWRVQVQTDRRRYLARVRDLAKPRSTGDSVEVGV